MDTFPGTHESALGPERQASILWVGVIGASVAGFLALATASQTYLAMLTHGHSFLRLFGWQLGCWSVWAIAAPWLVRVSVRYSVRRLVALGLVMTCVQTVIATALAVWLQPYLPIASYDFMYAMANLWWFPVLVDPLVYGLLVVGGRGFAAYEHARRLELRESQLEAQLTRAQLDALRLEIQPHFLFNTLNTAAALIRVNDNSAALSMLLGLSDLMRATLDAPPGQLAPLGSEIQLIKQYVDLQRARFGDRLVVTYHVEPGCEAIPVPTFLLQPIVENALRHGLATPARACHLVIGAAEDTRSRLRVWVMDDGTGLPSGFDLGRDAGTGLRNTRSRLARLYGDAATLSIRPNADVGTIVELTMPAARGAWTALPATDVA